MRKKAHALTLALFIIPFLFSTSVKAAPDDDQPTVVKDTVQVTAFTYNVYKGNYDNWSWAPIIKYRVNGPIPSGAQLYVEFSLPTGLWVKFDCGTEETTAGRWYQTECGGRDGVPEDKSSTYTGLVTFNIKLRNELAGTNSTLFTGKAKVEKAHSNEAGPKAVNKWVYFINHDWNLPIGYVYLTPDSLKGWDWPDFHVAFWIRGDSYRWDPHVFYQGKEIGRIALDGDQIGRAGCESEVDNNTTHYVEETLPQKAKWSRIVCSFPNIKGLAKNIEMPSLIPGQVGQIYNLAENPGEYEFKILQNNKLSRSMKFSVSKDGLVENGIATNSKLGRNRVIVPVQIIGDQDGVWDKNAWKDAFYGNPLVGFTPIP
jgi:hypothetical protein